MLNITDRTRTISGESGIYSPPTRRPSFNKQNSTSSITRGRKESIYEEEENCFQRGVLSTSESQRSSKIPVSKTKSLSLRRSHDAASSAARNRRASHQVNTSFNAEDFESLTTGCGGGPISGRSSRAGSVMSRRSSRRSSMESLADSVVDDMKWQLGESDLDISVRFSLSILHIMSLE